MHRINDRFQCSVFRKSTFTGLGTSFYSFCSYNFKINSIKTLLFRAYGLCTNYFTFHKEIEFLINFFHSNGYCSNLIRKQISNFLNSRYLDNNNTCIPNQPSFYISLPYFGPQSDKLKLELSKLLNRYFTEQNFILIFTNTFTIGIYFNFKDKLSPAMRSSVVYKYSCVQCTSDYIGMTSRNLYMRVAEHAGKSFRTGSVLSQPPHSAIRDHCHSCVSLTPIAIDKFSIIDKSSDQLDLKILESLHIFKSKPSLNNSLSSFPLSIANK